MRQHLTAFLITFVAVVAANIASEYLINNVRAVRRVVG